MTHEPERFIGWYVLPASLKLHPDSHHALRVGDTLSIDGQIVNPPDLRSETALHAFEFATYALRNAIPHRNEQHFVLCRMELWGDIVKAETLASARHRKLLGVVPSYRTKYIVLDWAYQCAFRALSSERDEGREPDSRGWAALDAVRKWLDGRIAMNIVLDSFMSIYNATLVDGVPLAEGLARRKAALESAADVIMAVVRFDENPLLALSYAAISANESARAFGKSVFLVSAQNTTLLETMLLPEICR